MRVRRKMSKCPFYLRGGCCGRWYEEATTEQFLRMSSFARGSQPVFVSMVVPAAPCLEVNSAQKCSHVYRRCDRLAGLCLLHSLAGGTGSGLGTCLTEVNNSVIRGCNPHEQ